MDPKKHWESVYQARDPAEASWFQAEATLSLALIREAAPPRLVILDVGGGSSTLVDGLLARGLPRHHRARHLGGARSTTPGGASAAPHTR